MSSQPVMQFSFNSGEWAPALNARVDIAKYHSGAALLENFFVDYRGGATASPGTRYIATSPNNGAYPPRLIGFQASFTISYILEFGVTNGVGYLQFYNNGAAVLSGGVPYTIASPYASVELSQLKFVQDVNQMVLCHPNHPPYVLTLNSATNWTLAAITFGATVAAPTSPSLASTLGTTTTWNYAYVITAVDANGQESAPSAFAALGGLDDLRSTAGSNIVTWAAVAGASSYNIYKAEQRLGAPVPAGAGFGFAGNATGTTFIDSNIAQDFSQGPPIAINPFFGTGVSSVTMTANGNFANLTVPTPTFSGGGGSGAAAIAICSLTSATVASGGAFYAIGDTLNLFSGAILRVTGLLGGGGFTNNAITTVAIVFAGTLASGSTLTATPNGVQSTSGSGRGATFNLAWGMVSIGLSSPGTNYSSAPTVGGISSGGATATATIGAPSSGNPSVPGFFQQRLVLAGPPGNPQQFNMSQTGFYFNYDVNNPLEADDAIEATLVSGQLNIIQSMVAMPYGLIVFSDKQAWLINGGSNSSAVTPSNLVANPQAYNGASYPPPITANDNILYVQAKGSIVRDLVFNYYTQVYTGTDISVLSSHLFYGFNILEWAWAEEPFKLVYAVRNDGVMLNLTFLKEQELIAWAHRITQGSFKSVASITETVPAGAVDAVYVVVQRTINGAVVQYIERFTEVYYPLGLASAWQVDAGIQYQGSGALTFTGATQLAGATVTGTATSVGGNTEAIIPFVMPTNGTFTLPIPSDGSPTWAIVTVGLPYTPKLQTLQLDTGEPTIQGKRKKISAVTVRVANTLGLSIGQTFDPTSQVPMSDLVVGNLNVPGNYIVTTLINGDARTIIDPDWNVPGQYCIQQSLPFPASILGVIPEIEIGDTAK